MVLGVTGPYRACVHGGWEKQRIRARSATMALGGGWNANETLSDQTIAGGFLLGVRKAGFAGYRRGC